MIPMVEGPVPLKYKVIFASGAPIGARSRFALLTEAEAQAEEISCVFPEGVVEVWDLLLVCPMAWYKAGEVGWRR